MMSGLQSELCDSEADQIGQIPEDGDMGPKPIANNNRAQYFTQFSLK